MASKLPFMQFYTRDWLQDTRRLNPSTKGHWMDLLCAMWDSPTRGQIAWTLSAYARHLGVSVEEAEVVLHELFETSTADGGFQADVNGNCSPNCQNDHRGDEEDIRTGVSFGYVRNCQEHITLRNRRMWEDEEKREIKREQDRIDQQNKRERDKSQGPVRVESDKIHGDISEVRSQKTDKDKRRQSPSGTSRSSGKPASGTEWDESLFFVRDFLEDKTLAPPLTHPELLKDNDWWADVHRAINGFDLPFLEREFATISTWLMENPSRRPLPTSNSTKRFVRNWLKNTKERERRLSNGPRNYKGKQ